MLYRAYRVPYDWVPQLKKPAEVAVDPGSNRMFMIPAKDGSRPDFGLDKTTAWDPDYNELSHGEASRPSSIPKSR
jgi:hypothetical protein